MKDWNAYWIWYDSSPEQASPRNRWQCFRKRFFVENIPQQKAKLSLTADSRYQLFVNGQLVGDGPSRGWTEEWFYDTYDISHHLRSGENVIAVLVMHYGVSTFYYQKGRGGLLAQLDYITDTQAVSVLRSDASWKTRICQGQNPRANRMACQQAFTEHIDGRAYSEDWTGCDYDDSSWDNAQVIGEPGMAPWFTLQPRNIPFLAEEAIPPARVDSLASFRPAAYTTYIDVRTQMLGDSPALIQETGWLGFVATSMCVEQETEVFLDFPQAFLNFGDCWLNGTLCQPEPCEIEDIHRQFRLTLAPGKNLFVIDVSCYDLGRGFHFALDGNHPIQLSSPLGEHAATPWVAIGPFQIHIRERFDTAGSLDFHNETYLSIKKLIEKGKPKLLLNWMVEIPSALVSEQNVFARSICKQEFSPKSIPYSLQSITSRQPAVIPQYDNSDTQIILDFGSEWSGYIEFEVEANEGCVLDFYGYEYQFEGWRQETSGLDNTMRYTCRNGRQSYRSKVRRGFRYLMLSVSNASRPIVIHRLHVIQSNYPVSQIGSFRCDDALLNAVWQMGQRTLRICMEDTFVDCPSEQAYWVGDSRNEALINYYVYGDADIVKRCLQLVPGSRSLTPYYASHVPTGFANVIPNFTFLWVVSCLEHYEWTGNLQFVKDIWPHICYTLDHYLQRLDARGLFWTLGWTFFDWAPIDSPESGIATHENAFLYRALKSACQLGALVEDDEHIHRYAKLADAIRNAVNHYLWDDKRKAYIDCIHGEDKLSTSFSIQSQVAVYAAGIPEEDQKRWLNSYLLECPKDFVRSGSPFVSFFHYECLTSLGLFEDILADIRRNYGMMLERDARTCWEMYPTPEKLQKKNAPPTRSHCHAWAAAPCYFLGAYVLGVRSETPGWDSVIIQPNPSGLRWANGSIPLPNGGRIDASWEIITAADNGTKQMIIRVQKPGETTVTVVPPQGIQCEVHIDSV